MKTIKFDSVDSKSIKLKNKAMKSAIKISIKPPPWCGKNSRFISMKYQNWDKIPIENKEDAPWWKRPKDLKLWLDLVKTISEIVRQFF